MKKAAVEWNVVDMSDTLVLVNWSYTIMNVIKINGTEFAYDQSTIELLGKVLTCNES
jgi:hypothetical protein